MRKEKARDPIGIKVRLPVEESVSRSDVKRVVQDGNPEMGCGMQSNYLRPESGRMLVLIAGPMIQRDLNTIPLTQPAIRSIAAVI